MNAGRYFKKYRETKEKISNWQLSHALNRIETLLAFLLSLFYSFFHYFIFSLKLFSASDMSFPSFNPIKTEYSIIYGMLVAATIYTILL